MCKRHHMSRGPAFFLSALLVPVFLIAGCETPEDDPDMTPDWTEEETQTDTIEFTANFSDVQDSGISGEAKIMRPEANHVATVIVELEDLPQEGEYVATLHRGTCEEMGAEVVSLNPVQGLADMTGQSQTTLETHEIPRQEDLSIHVYGPHQQPQQQPQQQQQQQPQPQRAVACADIDRDDLWRDRERRDRDRDDPWN